MLVLAILTAIFIVGKSQPMLTPYIVAQDGSGTFQTIKAAIDAAPNHNPQKHYILIKAGVYYEHIIISKEKTNIILIGEGIEKTVISGNRNNASGFPLQDTATVGIKGDGFMAQGITFENRAGPRGYQAVAVSSNAKFLTFYWCRFLGYQDTLYAKYGYQFYRECDIIGTIDFIFGDFAAVFQNCILRIWRPLQNQYITITAQGRTNGQANTGFIFQNCTVNADDLNLATTHFTCYLGRPWKDFSRTVFMQSFLDDLVDPKGWIEWEGKVPAHPYFAEYANRGPGAHLLGTVNWSTIISTRAEASQFTLRKFLNGGTWIPPTVPRYLDLL